MRAWSQATLNGKGKSYNVDDVHDGILAHEITHVIVDHYLNIRPSKAIAEIIANYVDENLYN